MVKLTAFQESLILSCCPPGSRVVESRYFREEYLPCPIRCVVSLPGGGTRTLVLRGTRKADGNILAEGKILPLLSKAGLPVAPLLAGPARDRHGGVWLVLGLLPGGNLQDLSASGPEGLEAARGLVVEAVLRLHSLTGTVEASSVGSTLPRRSLSAVLADIEAQGGPWKGQAVYETALRSLKPRVRVLEKHLAFTNGDYQPANFLAQDGVLSGFVDFEYAGFEDPLYGWAKYRVYDIYPLDKAGVVDLFLKRAGYSPEEFALRLAVRCLWTLQKEIDPRSEEGETAEYRSIVLGHLKESLEA